MHVKTHLLDYIRYVKTGECEILQSTCQTPVQGRIITRSIGGSTEFLLDVNRSSRRFARRHAVSSNNVTGVGTLIEEQATCMSGHCNTQKVTQRSEILHSKLGGKKSHHRVTKVMTRTNEDDVINIEQYVRHIRTTLIDEEGVI